MSVHPEWRYLEAVAARVAALFRHIEAARLCPIIIASTSDKEKQWWKVTNRRHYLKLYEDFWMRQEMNTTSEVARMRQQVAAEYLSAKLGLSGLAYGTSRHRFITARMERMGESFQTLSDLVGSQEQAIQIIAETLQEVPEKATRHEIVTVLLHELGDMEATQHLLEYVKELWETYDLLIERFGPQAARIIIQAPVCLPQKEVIS
jgi:alkylated DNA nucleotide flippase Atl1